MRFYTVRLAVVVTLASLCVSLHGYAQIFDTPPGDADAGAAAGGADADDVFGFGGDSQQPNAQDQALVEAETERLNQEAAAKLEEGDPNGALTLYDEAIRANPNFASYMGKGRILKEQEEAQAAMMSFARAAQFSGTVEDPSTAVPAFIELGQALLDTEQYNQAISTYSEALRLPNQSRNSEILYHLGMAQTEFAINQPYPNNKATQELLIQALESFDKAIRVDPEYADAYYERGNTHVLLQDADKALDDLGQAVTLDPENTDAIAQFGFVSLQRGLGETARRNGQAAKIAFDLNRSVEQLTKWLNIVPVDQEVDEEDLEAIRRENVLLNRSAAYIGLGDEQAAGNGGDYYQQAIADAEAAIEIDAEKADAHYQKGLALRMMGDLAAAVESFTETLALSPGNPEALLRRGIVYFRQNDLELAKSDLQKSVRYTPRGFNPRANFWLGLCHQMQGDINKAVLAYSKAIRMQSGFLDAHLNRGLAYMKQGRFSRAMLDFNEVLRIDGDHAQARSLRQQCMTTASR